MKNKNQKIKELKIKSKTEIIKAKQELKEKLDYTILKINDIKKQKKDLLKNHIKEIIEKQKKFRNDRILANENIKSKIKLIKEEKKIIELQNLLAAKDLLLKKKENKNQIMEIMANRKKKSLEIKEKFRKEFLDIKKTWKSSIDKIKSQIIQNKIEINNQINENKKNLFLKKENIKESYKKILEEKSNLNKLLNIKKNNDLLENKKISYDLKKSIIKAKKDYQNIILNIKESKIKKISDINNLNFKNKRNKIEQLKQNEQEKIHEKIYLNNEIKKIKDKEEKDIQSLKTKKLNWEKEQKWMSNSNNSINKKLDPKFSNHESQKEINKIPNDRIITLIKPNKIKKFNKINKKHSKYDIKKLNLSAVDKKLIKNFQKLKNTNNVIDIKEFVKYVNFNVEMKYKIEEFYKIIISAIVWLLEGKVLFFIGKYFYIKRKKGLKKIVVSSKPNTTRNNLIFIPQNSFWQEMEKVIIYKLNKNAYIKIAENIAMTKIENEIQVINDVPFIK